MPARDAAVKKALFRDMVPVEKPPAKPARGNKAARGNWPTNPYAQDCPTRLVLDRIADKWTVLLLILLSRRPWRFNELRREISGLTQKMASQTLKGLERDGLVKRKVTPTVPVTVEYSITPLGRTLSDTVDGLRIWAERHMSDVAKAQSQYDRTKAQTV
ncbi:MAG: helix-turn-helix transcriptional regulator [Candidatus Afipia apatlaquensis]|uniref:Helix-turn-helix transcriptional regulator n=1 Tax=Candidatus Afipia apatlaquensis TaxID=2712852 RepID=A0A7C9VIG8_9BRAD|nr:helix-turn-helix transcriptional regulator [Candidatus Afipia apatlaquensis]